MIVQLVVAADERNAIGIDNQLPWHLPDDLKFFKAKTLNHPIIMGRKTFDSLGKPLPKRLNIVLSKHNPPLPDDVILYRDLGKALEHQRGLGETLVSIIGGGQIFKEALHFADAIWLTRVHTVIENADIFFPELDENIWSKVWEEEHVQDEKHAFGFTKQQWKRRTVL